MSSKSSAQLTRSFLLAATMVCAASAPALAQTSNRDVEGNARWSLSAGADPFKPSIGSTSENFVAALGREWRRQGSRLGFRTRVTVGAGPSSFTQFNVLTCGDCSIARHRSFGELSAEATYTFRRSRAIQPYFFGGPALYGVRSRYFASGVTFGDPSNDVQMTWSLGATMGFGTRFRVFGKEFFVEQGLNIQELSTGSRDGLVVRPFVLGIHF